ncbi:MAG TPA: hypothetical protein VI669_08510, partial [Vicinamibacteria bacterium]
AAAAAAFVRSRAPQPEQTRAPVASGGLVIAVWQRGHCIQWGRELAKGAGKGRDSEGPISKSGV